MIYPDSLNKAIDYLKKLPGIGEKSAERMALSIIDMDEEDVKALSESITNCKEKMHKCINCGSLTEEDLEKKINVPIYLQDERMTTSIAQNILIEGNVRRKDRKKVVDQVAATIILQDYLDRKEK